MDHNHRTILSGRQIGQAMIRRADQRNLAKQPRSKGKAAGLGKQKIGALPERPEILSLAAPRGPVAIGLHKQLAQPIMGRRSFCAVIHRQGNPHPRAITR